MIVTINDLFNNGAKCSRYWFFDLISAKEHVLKDGTIQAVFDTEDILSLMNKRRLNKMNDYSREKMEKVMVTVEDAIKRIKNDTMVISSNTK